jgi:AbrB family looped-hinge helix DNA binding protein
MERTSQRLDRPQQTLDGRSVRSYNSTAEAIEVIPQGDEEMLGTQLTTKGQVTVPKDVRDALKLGAGDKVYFVADGDRAIMVPLTRDIWSIRGALKKYAKGKKFNWKKIREAAHRAAAERHIRALGESKGSK